MIAANMDVNSLNHDCEMQVQYWHMGDKFVPLYAVIWSQDGKTKASVELFEPTKTLRKLRIEDNKYNLRRALQVEDRNRYLDAPTE